MAQQQDENSVLTQPRDMVNLVVCVSSASGNVRHRNALRKSSWFTLAKAASDPASGRVVTVQLFFVVCQGGAGIQDELERHQDMLLIDVPEGYHNLWRKALESMKILEQQYTYAYYMHADDDSYVRLDLITRMLATSPLKRFYWGYIWDGSGNRVTQPIRNPRNKSYMPVEQYPLDYYPPFASGCGFILSRDLVQALLWQPLPDYRLLDPPFGIHLCGTDSCVLPDGPVKPVHDEHVRPYRGIPIFKADTIVQHYLTPEEMMPFHKQVMRLQAQEAVPQPQSASSKVVSDAQSVQPASVACEPPTSPADSLYAQLVQLGLLRR